MGGEECQYKHRCSGFLQARRAAELISRYWFLTVAHLLLCPPARRRACAPPLYRLPARRPDNLSLVSLTASALLLYRLVQQLIRHPHHHPFFFTSPPPCPSISTRLPSPFCLPSEAGGGARLKKKQPCCRNSTTTTDPPFCQRVAIRPSAPDFY